MPRIKDEFLDCAIYLYPSVDAANMGRGAGGSGFLVGIPSEMHREGTYLYAVSNSHVVGEPGKSPVVRLNTQKGDLDIIPLKEEDWIHHPGGDDVAICPIVLSPEIYKYKVIGQNILLTESLMSEYSIGIGDDVFMVGRLITHQGKQRNMPVLRFGNIAMMPMEPIKQRERGGFEQISFLVEARSVGGFSGSPVFVYMQSLIQRPDFPNFESVGFGPWLLGIDWGHIDFFSRVPEALGKPFNAGMTAVVPAWKLNEFVNSEELVLMRKKINEHLAREKKEKGGEAVLDSEPFFREDFEDALKKVSRPKEAPPDQEKTST
jgi:hypothetical protein